MVLNLERYTSVSKLFLFLLTNDFIFKPFLHKKQSCDYYCHPEMMITPTILNKAGVDIECHVQNPNDMTIFPSGTTVMIVNAEYCCSNNLFLEPLKFESVQRIVEMCYQYHIHLKETKCMDDHCPIIEKVARSPPLIVELEAMIKDFKANGRCDINRAMEDDIVDSDDECWSPRCDINRAMEDDIVDSEEDVGEPPKKRRKIDSYINENTDNKPKNTDNNYRDYKGREHAIVGFKLYGKDKEKKNLIQCSNCPKQFPTGKIQNHLKVCYKDAGMWTLFSRSLNSYWFHCVMMYSIQMW